MAVIHATPSNTRAWRFAGIHYARVGFVSYLGIGRLIVYRRVGERRSFRPTLETKKGA